MNTLFSLLQKLNAIGNDQTIRVAEAEEKCPECGEVHEGECKVEEAAKPDFLDIDKDGDKEEDMKDAAKDKEQVDECGEMPIMSPMSMVGDTDPMAPVIAPGIAAPEMGMEPEVPAMEPEAPAEKPASYTLSIRNGDSTLNMTTDSPDEIIHVMKLAGVKGEATVKKAEPKPEGEEQVEEEFENTPDATRAKEPQSFGDIRDWGRKGTGASKPGYQGTKASGDNPMSEEKMFEDYKAFKGSK